MRGKMTLLSCKLFDLKSNYAMEHHLMNNITKHILTHVAIM